MREKFKSVKATRGRDPYCVTGEFWRGVVVVDGEGVVALRGVDVVVDGGAVVSGADPYLCPRMSARLCACAPCGRPPAIPNYPPRYEFTSVHVRLEHHRSINKLHASSPFVLVHYAGHVDPHPAPPRPSAFAAPGPCRVR